MLQDLSHLPAPQFGTYSQPGAIPAQKESLALAATSSLPADAFPTRRQLRQRLEEAERLAAAEAQTQTHPQAPFAMPAAPAVAAAATIAAAPVETPGPVETPAPVSASAVAPTTSVIEQPVAPAPTIEPAPYLSIETVPAAPEVSVAPLPAVVPVATANGTSATGWPFQPTAAVTGAAEGLDSSLDTASGIPYHPFGMIPKISAGQAAPPDRSSTVSVWLIAVIPLVMVGVGLLAVTSFGEFYTRFMQGGLLFIFALATIALAVRDRRDLLNAGHASTASPAWILLTPLAYLVARSIVVYRSTRRGTAPLWVWLVLVAGITAAAFLLPDWLDRFVTVDSLF
jgi:hypothetical protein